MRLIALIKKENLIIIKNWQSYFLALLVPILAVLVNIIMAQSAHSIINIGVVSENMEISTIIKTELKQPEKIEFKIISYKDLERAIDELKAKNLSSVVSLSEKRNLTIFYDNYRQDSQIAAQYVINGLQSYISHDLAQNHPEDISKLVKNQKYIINPLKSITGPAAKNNEVNMMVLFGVMWIFIFFPINLAISQIQSEKNSSTMYYLFKINMSKFWILLAKQTAIILQCILSAFILMLIVDILNIYHFSFNILSLPLAVILIACMSSVGYFFGFILNNVSSSTLIVLILSLPTMLVTSLNTSTSLDGVIKIIPSYYSSQILRSILSEETINLYYIIICCIFTILFYCLAILIFSRRDPIKLCKIS